MGMFDFLRKKPPVQTLEVIPENPQQYIYPVTSDFRKGMWVKSLSGRIGILNKLMDNGIAEVHLTDAGGLTVGVEEFAINNLSRAQASEIPYERIKHLSRNELRDFGYGEL